MQNPVTISFPEEYSFSERPINLVKGLIGIYFIYLKNMYIQYPFRRSRLLYVGMSESKQNSIGNRLKGHLTGQTGNLALMNYAAKHRIMFTYQSFDLLRILGTDNLYELESFFLTDFLTNAGSFPICNNQSGVAILAPSIDPNLVKVLWETFEGPD